HGAFDLTLRIEQRRVARRRGEIDAECGGVESATSFLDIAAEGGQQIGFALADPGLSFVGAETRALRDRALPRREARGLTKRERNASVFIAPETVHDGDGN